MALSFPFLGLWFPLGHLGFPHGLVGGQLGAVAAGVPVLDAVVVEHQGDGVAPVIGEL